MKVEMNSVIGIIDPINQSINHTLFNLVCQFSVIIYCVRKITTVKKLIYQGQYSNWNGKSLDRLYCK